MIPAPEMLSFAIPAWALSWAPSAPNSCSSRRQIVVASSSSLSARVKAMSLLFPWWVACTIRSTFSPASPRASNRRAATPGRSGT